MNKYRTLARTIFTTGLAFLVNTGTNLFLTPFITSHIGAEAYGFVTLSKTFTQYAIYITMALNSFAARHIAVSWHQGDIQQTRRYYSSTFFGDLIHGSGILGIAIIGIWNLENLLSIPPELLTDVKWLFLLSFINFWMVTIFNVFGVAAYVKDKLDITGLFAGLSYLTEAGVLIFLYVTMPAKVLYVGWSLIGASAVVALSNLWITRKWFREMQIRLSYFSPVLIKKLVLDGFWVSLGGLGDQLNHGLDLLVCNLMLSATSMGNLAIAKTIHTLFSGIFGFIAQAFQPMFLKNYADGDKENLLRNLKLSMKVGGMAANIIYAGLVSLGMLFFSLWVPGQNTREIYWLTVINSSTAVMTGCMNPLYYIYTLTVKRKIPCLVTMLSCAANIIGMYALLKFTNTGVYAVVLTTACCVFVMSYITNPLYMAHVLNIPKSTFYPEIGKNLLSAAVLLVAFNRIAVVMHPNNWSGLILSAVVMAVIGAFLHIGIVCSKEERQRIVSMAGNVLKKSGNG